MGQKGVYIDVHPTPPISRMGIIRDHMSVPYATIPYPTIHAIQSIQHEVGAAILLFMQAVTIDGLGRIVELVSSNHGSCREELDELELHVKLYKKGDCIYIYFRGKIA